MAIVGTIINRPFVMRDNMELKDLIGKKIKVKIIGMTNSKKYYVGEDITAQYKVYIEDTKDYESEELIGSIEECIIINIVQEKLIGFILSNRKFLNDIKKIEQKLKKSKEYDKVKDIYLMERLKINGKVLGLYLVDEGEIGKYYLETKEIGTFIKKIKENNILFKDKKVEDELGKQIRDVVQSIDLTKKEISLNEENEKQRHLIEKAIGLEIGEMVTKIATLDLKQKIAESQKQVKKQIEQNVNNKIFLTKKQSTTKDINIKQEMEMNDKVTDMKTLGQLLEDNDKLPEMQGKKFVKMGVIESDHRDELVNTKGESAKVNTTRYSFVAIANDGTVVPLELSQDYVEGNNPREVNYQVNQKGEVEQDDVTSRFKIGQGTFAVKNGKYGEIKVYHSPRKTIGGKGIEGNKSLDRELETDNVWIMRKQERDLASEYKTGYRSVEEGYQEAKLHEDEFGEILEGDKVRTEDIDGNKNTKSHEHDNVDYEELATKWGYYADGKPNSEKAQELFEEKRKENPEKQEKEIIEMISKELEEEIGHLREER